MGLPSLILIPTGLALVLFIDGIVAPVVFPWYHMPKVDKKFGDKGVEGNKTHFHWEYGHHTTRSNYNGKIEDHGHHFSKDRSSSEEHNKRREAEKKDPKLHTWSMSLEDGADEASAKEIWKKWKETNLEGSSKARKGRTWEKGQTSGVDKEPVVKLPMVLRKYGDAGVEGNSTYYHWKQDSNTYITVMLREDDVKKTQGRKVGRKLGRQANKAKGRK